MLSAPQWSNWLHLSTTIATATRPLLQHLLDLERARKFLPLDWKGNSRALWPAGFPRAALLFHNDGHGRSAMSASSWRGPSRAYGLPRCPDFDDDAADIYVACDSTPLLLSQPARRTFAEEGWSVRGAERRWAEQAGMGSASETTS